MSGMNNMNKKKLSSFIKGIKTANLQWSSKETPIHKENLQMISLIQLMETSI